MKKVILKNIKEGDVFDFCYNQETREKLFDPYWCFDGQLITKKDRDGKLYLADTYWSSDNKTFELKEINKQGTLKFICNLNEIKEIEEWERDYYADDDIFDLSYQHHCYKAFYIKKNAEKSQAKMLEVLKGKMKEEKFKLESAGREIELLSEKITKVNDGDLSIYI